MKFASPGTIIHCMNIAGQTTQLNILDSKPVSTRGTFGSYGNINYIHYEILSDNNQLPKMHKSTPICKTTFRALLPRQPTAEKT